MSTSSQASKAADAAIKARLRQRAVLLLATEQGVQKMLKHAQSQILELLSGQPAQWQQWHLNQLLGQLEAVLTELGHASATLADAGVRNNWQLGADIVDAPLTAAGLQPGIHLPLLDTRVLQALRSFTVNKMQDVAAEALGKIAQQVGLVTIGALSPFEAIKAIQNLLGNATAQRATTIVRTEVSRAFAMATDARLVQAAELIPGLQKKWRSSGKIHSRENHDAMNNVCVDVDDFFSVPSKSGAPDLMRYPHDPSAPIGQTINCGCVMLPHMEQW